MLGDILQLQLRGSRNVYQQTAVQPMKGSVPKPEYKAWMTAPWSRQAAAIHATRDILSAPAYGSTKPNDFIHISGIRPPDAPTVISVPTVAGSNIPQGGVILP
jgi:hypothetical protein